jgi:hypothetical protein
MSQNPIQRGPVGAGLAAGNDHDWGVGVMESGVSEYCVLLIAGF